MPSNLTVEDKKIIHSLFWRSLALEGSFNYEKMQALGFAWAMFPVIKKYHKTKEAQAEALKRHTAFFNISPPLVTFPLGIAATMERQLAETGDIDPSTINAMKVSLMGPLSGIGDSLFWGTFRVIASGVGVALAQQGNVLGPILYMIMFTVPHLLIRYFCTVWGYQFGSKFIQNAYESGIIAQVTKLCTVVGLTTVGAMISSMVSIQFGFSYTMGDMEFVLQDVFDQIMPGIVPLALTMGVFLLIRKGVKINYLIIGMFVLGLLGAFIGLF